MNKLITIAALILTANTATASNWIIGVGHVDLKSDSMGVKLPGTQLSAGYKFQPDYSNFSITTEYSLISGSGDDTYETTVRLGRVNYKLDIKLEIEKAETLSVRGQYDMSGSYLFGGPIYSRSEITASALGLEVTAEDSDTGYLAGGGLNITDNLDVEIGYTKIGSIKSTGLMLRYNF